MINHDISSGRLTINGNSNDDYVITGSTDNTNNYVEVQFGYKGTITLSNCHFEFKSYGVHSPIRICGKNNLSNTDSSRTNVNIILDGDNYIYNSGYGRACIQVDQGAQINISAIEPCDNSSGTLTAIQRNAEGGAAIGSLDHYNNANETTATVLLSNGSTGPTAGGNVVISSGTVTAKGGHGAGIGGGYRTYYDGMIVIYGGIVDATAIFDAAGIGSGCPVGTGLVTEYAPNSAIVAIPPAVISAKGAGESPSGGVGYTLFSELGLAGTKVRIYIGDPAKPDIKVYTEDYLSDANVYVDLSQDPDINRVVTTTVNASLLDINQVLFGSTDASGIYSTTGELQNNTTFFTDATSKSAASLGRPYLPTATALPNGGEVELNLLEANFTIENFGSKILETSYTEQQAADSATCIKITYNDNIPITDLSFDFANGSGTDFCQPIFFDSDSLTVIPAPTSFQNGDIYYITIPIQNSKPSKVYSDVLRIIGKWNGVSTSYIRQIISQIVASTHTEYICEGESYLFHDQVLTEPGQYTNVTSTSGCNPESEVELLYLTVNPTYDTLIIDTICEGYNYMDYNFNMINPSAGVYNEIQNLSTIYGCDSIVRLNLTVNPSYDTLLIDTICQWDSYIQNGFVFDSMPAGFYQDTLFLNTIYGCDSIVKLNLIVGQLYDTTIVDYICEGETYNLNNFYFNANQTGNYLDTLFLTSIYGCDSIVKLDLTINPIFDTIISTAICEGDSYIDNGFSFKDMPDGFYQDTLFLNTILGCDSIVRLNLTVNPSYDITISESICEGESYKDNGFIFENMTAGSYNDIQLLKSIHGCDSIVRLNLTVHQNYDTTISASICEGEDYTENGFSFLNKPAGSYQDYLLLNSIHGCDSTVRIHLTVNETYSYDIQDSICEGEDYHMYGLDLINPNAGTYEHVSNLYTINGCDSIISVSLKVINKYEDVVIEGLEEISVATNLSTGCYKYTIGDVGKHEFYTWEIDNEDWVIYPDNNECIVCATTPDKGTLYVRAENYCGSVYDYIVLNADFIENQKNSKVTIYPNPITDFVNIQQSDISRINVYDSFGQIVIENNYNFDDQVTLDLSNLRSSIYIIEIITLEQTFVERVSIKK